MYDMRKPSLGLSKQVQNGGVVQSGPYEGQRYFLAGAGTSPGWHICNLSDGDGSVVQREIHEQHLEVE